MKILKNASSFKILTPVAELKDQLLRIERAGRTCYQSEIKEINWETAEKFVKMLIKRGHESVLEHSYLTVQFNNLSRGFTHEQVRHRLTAISQESTRYVDYAKEGEDVDLDKLELKCVVPPHLDERKKVDLGDGRKMSAEEMFQEYENFYRALRKSGWLPEEARQFLPIGVKSQIVISANFREWRHIFEMRTSQFAHWEIRKVMGDLLEELKGIIPGIFDDLAEIGKDQNGLRFFGKVKSQN
ncbi:MAG: FAD-dependent thymidylate synthase [Patescibacteria group bacterium]|nr:FAD-dependent thymidylate synthase [Patescibacteria group bacterium]MDD5173201.1 FAD-dependent thymidylate synthase [Patescibacteria group bacterium]